VRAAQLVVVFTSVHGLLHVLSQGRAINIVEQIKAAVNVVVFPKGALGPAVAGLGAQLANDRTLSLEWWFSGR
jgi:hypothetical protein